VIGEKVGKAKTDSAKKFGARVIDEPSLERLIRGEALPSDAEAAVEA